MGHQFPWWELAKRTWAGFCDDNVPRLGAALAFYTTFSIAPLLVISIAIASFFLGQEAASGHLKHELVSFLGEEGAQGIDAMLTAANQEKRTGIVSSIMGIVVLFFGATGVFIALKESMNTIWGVEQKPGSGIMAMIRDRVLSFAMVLSVAFLLLVSLVLSAILSAFGDWLAIPEAWAHLTDFLVSTLVVTLLFMLIFKYLPDAEIQWEDVWLGAIFTALLFAVGKYLIGAYLGNAAVGSSYGALGSLVVLLLWVYYSSQILFLGAEFTEAYAEMSGKQIVPAKNARAVASAQKPVSTPPNTGIHRGSMAT